MTHAVAGNWGLKRTKWALLTGCAFFVATSAVEAQTAWIGDPSANDWYDAANWDNGTPTSTDDTTIDTSVNLVQIDGGTAHTNDLVVGGTQSGQLWIYGAGVLDTFDAATVGQGLGGTGVVQVIGNSSEWIITSGLEAGALGSGTVSIQDGGYVSAASLTLGTATTGYGILEVTGAGSAFTAPALNIGYAGTGLVAVTSGGHLLSDTGSLGSASTALGTVEVFGSGSLWTNSGNIDVGNAGTGELTVENAGAVETGTLIIGHHATGDGTVVVTGSGSGLAVTGRLDVGLSGTGTLTIEKSGKVYSATGYLGSTSAGGNEVTISGSGSLWDVTGGLYAGFGGTDNILVEGGGALKTGFARLGEGTYGAGNVTVTGTGSTWDNSATLYVGDVGTGGLAIADGGAVTSDDSYVGFGAGSSGLVTVDGAGSSWNITDDLLIGGAGNGTVSIFDGGSVTTIDDVAVGTSTGTGRIGVATQSQLSVGGNLALGANATYIVGLDPASTSAGLIDVTGTATIDLAATLEVATDGPGAFSVGSHYTILTAAGGVTGTFANDTIPISAFFAFDTSYDANAVYLDVIQTAQLADAATTPNQIETAGGVDGLGAGSPIYDGVYSLPTLEAAADALDQLSGEGHASFKGVQLEDSRFVREAALGRGASGAPSAGIWGQLYGASDRLAGDGNAATADSATAGLVVGTDGLLGDTRLGVLVHAGVTELSIADRNTEGSSTDYGFGIYGGSKLADTTLTFGAAYTHHDVSITRDVEFAGFSDHLESSYGAATGQVFGEISHEMNWGDVSVTPYGQLAYVTHATDSFTEAGGDAALTAGASTTDATFTTIGLRASYAFALGEDGKAVLTGGAGWRHAFGDVPATENAFAGGDAFTILGAPLAEDSVALEGGLDLAFAGGLGLGLAYSGQVSTVSDAQSHALKLKVGGAF